MRVELILIHQKDLKEFRKQQWEKQKRRCAVTGLPLPFEYAVVDHLHKTKAEETGVDGKGLIRGVIHRDVNQLEGKITNTYKRYGLNKIASLPDILRSLADYLENPPVKNTVHPSAIPKIKKKKLSKIDAKRVYKYWALMFPKRKLPKIVKYESKEWAEYISQSKEYAKGKSK